MMPMTIKKWIRSIHDLGLIYFYYADLPNNLRDMRLLRRASSKGYIERVHTKSSGVALWKIRKRPVRWNNE